MYTRIDVGNILQSFALGRVVEGDSDVEEGNDKGHARRLGIHGPVNEDASSLMELVMKLG